MYAISSKAPQASWKFKQASAILDPIANGSGNCEIPSWG
jgi:hypothetical protein